MDWSDERYVRIYVRDTKTWKLLGWEGQTVLCLLARRFDRAGLLDDVRNGEDVALMIGSGFPIDVADRGLVRLVDNGVMKVVDIGLFWPNFMEAQEATQSDRQRQRECRARRREKARLDNASQDVTKTPDSVTSCHEVSQPVTPYRTVPCSTVPNRTKSKSPRTRGSQLKNDWNPTDDHKKLAQQLGVDWQHEVAAFRDHALATGRTLKNWDAGFRNWLRQAKKFGGKSMTKTKHQQNMDFLRREMEAHHENE